VAGGGHRRVGLALLVAGAVAVADQTTKWWALRALDDRAIDLGPVDLRLSFNSGTAFGLGGGVAPVLVVVAVVVLVVVLARGGLLAAAPSAVAAGLVLGGAVGNLLDRLFRGPGWLRGKVVDFVDLGWWPVFNLADSAIVVGAVLLVLVARARDRREATAS
jgi:signal peptidase II